MKKKLSTEEVPKYARALRQDMERVVSAHLEELDPDTGDAMCFQAICDLQTYLVTRLHARTGRVPKPSEVIGFMEDVPWETSARAAIERVLEERRRERHGEGN